MNEEYHGIKRDKIPWHPSVDYEKCINCGTCVEYCKLGVYTTKEEEGEAKPVVTGCEGQCPVGAISFPSKQKTRELIKKLEKNE